MYETKGRFNVLSDCRQNIVCSLFYLPDRTQLAFLGASRKPHRVFVAVLGLPLLANPLEVSLCPQSAHAAIPLFVPSSLFYNERYRNSYGGESDDQEIKVSTTDPESGYYVKGERGKQFAYSVHAASDAHGFVLGAIVTPGNVHDSVAFPDLLDRGLRPPET